MKLRHPRLIWAAAVLGSWLIRLWMRNVRYQARFVGGDVDPCGVRPGRRLIYAFWHENLLQLASAYGGTDSTILISQHADGQMITEICQRLGYGIVRGSTTRGGISAVRELVRFTGSHLAITPDGPRGPRRQVQPGLIYLAARTGIPIVPIGAGFERPWRMNSWDRFVLPRPGCRSTAVFLHPIHVPANIGREQLEPYSRQIEAALNEANELAEQWATTGEWPADYQLKSA